MNFSDRYGTISTINGGVFSSQYVNPTINYKGVEITYDELDKLIAKKKPVKPKSKERIVFDGDYTTYYDENGKDTIIKRMSDDEYDAEKAVLYVLLRYKGIKPKKVQELLANSIDKAAKRVERAERKELKKQLKNKRELEMWIAEKMKQQEACK